MSLTTGKAPENAFRIVTDHALEDIRGCDAQLVECGIAAGDAIEVSTAGPQEVGVESIQHFIYPFGIKRFYGVVPYSVKDPTGQFVAHSGADIPAP